MAEAVWPAGTPVEVRNRFNGSWTSGFEVAGATDPDHYELRRRSDHAVLPAQFTTRELRPDGRTQ